MRNGRLFHGRKRGHIFPMTHDNQNHSGGSELTSRERAFCRAAQAMSWETRLPELADVLASWSEETPT